MINATFIFLTEDKKIWAATTAADSADPRIREIEHVEIPAIPPVGQKISILCRGGDLVDVEGKVASIDNWIVDAINGATAIQITVHVGEGKSWRR